jgi:hypothetical protein
MNLLLFTVSDLYSSPNIIRVIKLRIPSWEACGMYEQWERCIHGFGGGNLRERAHLEDTDVDGKII